MASLQVLSITSPPISSSVSLSSQQSCPLFAVCRRRLLLKSESSSLFIKISVKKPQYVSLLPRRGPLRIFMNLPTANSEWAAVGKIVKWSQRAIRSFCIAETVACKMTYDFTGTEALLMGILIEGTSPAAKYLRAIGFTLSKVKELSLKFREVKKPWERAYQFKVPLTEHAQKALDSAVEEKIKLGETGEVTTSHMLLGIWTQKGSTGQKILAYLGFDDKKAEELKTSIKEVVMR